RRCARFATRSRNRYAAPPQKPRPILATSAAQWAAVISTALSPRYLAIVVILVAVYALFRKTSLHIASYVPAAFVLAQATTTVLKHTINRERPPVAAQLVETHDPSFPSGHSSAAFAIAAAVVILLWTKQWQPRHPGMVGMGGGSGIDKRCITALSQGALAKRCPCWIRDRDRGGDKRVDGLPRKAAGALN